MNWGLPDGCIEDQALPKNAFHPHLSAAQRRLLTAEVDKMRWWAKLSPDSVNLPAGDVPEIQVFSIQLRKQVDLKTLWDAVEKAIPYTLVLWLEHDGMAQIRSSKKHPHAIDVNRSVLDWTFQSDWFPVDEVPSDFELVGSLDTVALKFWRGLSGAAEERSDSIEKLVEDQQLVWGLKNKIKRLEQRLAKEKQFNRKVELNQEIGLLRNKLSRYE